MEQKLIMYGIPALVLLSPVFAWLYRQLRAKVDEKGWVVLGKAMDFAGVIVADLNATMKDKMLAASSDGRLSPEEKAMLKAEAVARLKLVLMPAELKTLAPEPVSQDMVLGAVVEKAVAVQKRPSMPLAGK